jgi:hypothetical protein
MKKHDIVIIHGTGGSPQGNWFFWLKQQLENNGHRVFVPKFPTPENQSIYKWHAALVTQVERMGKDTILIGHSCGATFLLHVLEALAEPVEQSILASPFIEKLGNEYFDNLNETFVDYEFDWDLIKKNAGKITILHGDNDPYVPIAAAQKVADALNASLTIIPNGGHLNAEFGFTEFPQILQVLT